jgi:hypothetical protein
MAHMKPVAEHFAAYHVETDCGTEIVPEDVCGSIDLGYLTAHQHSKLLAYCEGSRIEEVERCEGWYARLSAPGYLDATEWHGPFDTEAEALASVKEMFEVDDNGEDDSGPDNFEGSP